MVWILSPSVMSSTNITLTYCNVVGRQLPYHANKASNASSAGHLLKGEGTGKELRL